LYNLFSNFIIEKAAHERDRVSTGAIKDNEITRTLNIIPEDREFYKAQLVTDISVCSLLLMYFDCYSLIVIVSLIMILACHFDLSI
jgi:hypothetical protein